MKMIFDN